MKLILCALAMLAAATSQASAQDECPEQVSGTITGGIRDFHYVGEEWNMWVLNTPCEIIYIHGRGRIPTKCSRGTTFKANGTIKFWGGTNHFLVDSISCP